MSVQNVVPIHVANAEIIQWMKENFHVLVVQNGWLLRDFSLKESGDTPTNWFSAVL